MSGSSKEGDNHAAFTVHRSSRMNRQGPDGSLLVRATPFVAVMFVCWTTLFYMVGLPLVLAIVPGGLVTLGITWAGLNTASVLGRLFGRFLLPTGASTPYEHQFSREEAMAARGDVSGALESLEAAVATTPLEALTGINVRIRAAELYMDRAAKEKNFDARGADQRRAVELFREIQRFPGTSASQDIYVSNRIIDLLIGPLRQPSRALVELGRIVARYPSSAAATHARTAIARLKDELRQSAAEEEKYTGF